MTARAKTCSPSNQLDFDSCEHLEHVFECGCKELRNGGIVLCNEHDTDDEDEQ